MQVEKPGYERIVPYIPPGLKVDEKDRFLELKIGNSHYTHFHLKEAFRVVTADYKAQWMVISGGPSTASVGQLATRIRSIRPAEPYKGKGIRYSGQIVLRKEGKRAQV